MDNMESTDIGTNDNSATDAGSTPTSLNNDIPDNAIRDKEPAVNKSNTSANGNESGSCELNSDGVNHIEYLRSNENSDSSYGAEEDYGSKLLQEGLFYDNEIQVSEKLVESLTQGFMEKFIPSLTKNKKTVDQIRTTQSVLIETVQQENSKFSECVAIEGLEDTMTKAKLYHAKLIKLRKDMTALHEKSSKLKRRALRLQQQRQKEEMTRAQTMEAEYEKEKLLTARVASTPPSPDKET